MTTLSLEQTNETTTPAHASVGLASMVKGIVKALLSPRDTYLKHKAPASSYVHQLRRDIKGNHAKPVEMLMRVTFADLDDGVPLAMATQWMQEALTCAEQYHARRERRLSSGVIPFSQRLERAAVRETTAQAKADVAEIVAQANPDDPAKLREAVLALEEYDGPKESLLGVLTERIVQLESAG